MTLSPPPKKGLEIPLPPNMIFQSVQSIFILKKKNSNVQNVYWIYPDYPKNPNHIEKHNI